jgi:hypothetical protein
MATDIDFAPDGFLYAVENESRKVYQIDPSLGIIVAEYGPYEIAPWGLASQPLDGPASTNGVSTPTGLSTLTMDDTRSTAKCGIRDVRAKLQRVFQEPPQVTGDAPSPPSSHSTMTPSMLSAGAMAQDPNLITYDVFLDTSTPPTTLICDDIETRQRDPGRLQACTTYYWQVRAENACGEQKAGPIWSFKTETIPADFDKDCDVDLSDLAVFASYWLYGLE